MSPSSIALFHDKAAEYHAQGQPWATAYEWAGNELMGGNFGKDLHDHVNKTLGIQQITPADTPSYAAKYQVGHHVSYAAPGGQTETGTIAKDVS